MVKEAEYKCPYAAAYMMKHFGIAVMVDSAGCPDGENELLLYSNAASFLQDRLAGDAPGRILWNPESEWIFEPKHGDIVMIEKRPDELVPAVMLGDEAGKYCRITTILSRNGKPLIMPEIK